MSNFNQSSSFQGLNTYTLVIPSTDTYTFDAKIQTPVAESAMISYGGGGGAGTGVGGAPTVPSQVVVTVQQNGSTIYTSNPGDKGFIIPGLACVAEDVITFALSSSLNQDQQPNAVRMTLAVSEGPN